MILNTHPSILKVLDLVRVSGAQLHISGSAEFSMKATLLDANDESIQVQIAERGPTSLFGLYESHVIRVYVSGHPMQFKCQLLATVQGADEDTLLAKFSFPTEIERKDARGHIRVRVQEQRRYPVTFTTAQCTFTGNLIDVSHAGLRMTMDNLVKPSFLVGLPGKIVIQKDGQLIEISAIPMWQSDTAIGLLLPEMQQISPNDTSHFWTEFVREMLFSDLCEKKIAA